ncbi:MAG TPA: carbon monoxide dehydrogenase, partial [bacterium]|nr:carbon monoxide dehydrogenase [bacterium]
QRRGFSVILIDADPAMNLQLTLGLEGSVVPLSEMKELIQERTESETSPVFKLNPRVDDIPEKYFLRQGNLLLGVMGTIRAAGSGCTCPENAFLKALLRHLILRREEFVILDMEAGIEHLGRGTTMGIDWLIILTEPGEKSVQTAYRIDTLARQLGLKKIGVVGNFVRSKSEEDFLREKLKGLNLLGFLPYEETIRETEIAGKPFSEKAPHFLRAVETILFRMEDSHET